jgi:hypothetical protein
MSAYIEKGILYDEHGNDWHITDVAMSGMAGAHIDPQTINYKGYIVVSNNTAHFEIGCAVYHCTIGNETAESVKRGTDYAAGFEWARTHKGMPRKYRSIAFEYGVRARRDNW